MSCTYFTDAVASSLTCDKGDSSTEWKGRKKLENSEMVLSAVHKILLSIHHSSLFSSPVITDTLITITC